jgi:hypothetical protein
MPPACQSFLPFTMFTPNRGKLASASHHVAPLIIVSFRPTNRRVLELLFAPDFTIIGRVLHPHRRILRSPTTTATESHPPHLLSLVYLLVVSLTLVLTFCSIGTESGRTSTLNRPTPSTTSATAESSTTLVRTPFPPLSSRCGYSSVYLGPCRSLCRHPRRHWITVKPSSFAPH